MLLGTRILTLFALLPGLPASAPSTAPARGGEDVNVFEHPVELDVDREPRLRTDGSALIRNVTIHSAVGPAEVGDVLVRDGDIAAIGRDLSNPGVTEIDGTGKHLAPGAVDTHSHMAIERGINEGTLSITADCDITDVINADDVALYNALGGGTTTIQCLHGSANAIGGRSEVLKLRWHATADELRFPDAPQGIKFALGENPKRANWGDDGRYPATRMGVESIFQRGFARAQEYQREWATYEAERARGGDPAPPRRDVRLEVLAGILTGDVHVHSHCYRADEILMLLRTAEHFGFRIATLQHVLEGFKVAHEIAEHGAGGSTFSDWWGYKAEAYDAIPQNAALMDEAGVLSTINSDDDQLVRHLFQEAGKSVRYAGMDRVRALALATINGARQLSIDDRVGSIEVGKDADLVLFDGDPLTFTSRVEWTMVDGEIEFQRRDAFGLDAEPLHARPLEHRPVIEASAAEVNSGAYLALVGGTLHPVTSAVVEHGTLLLRGKRIVDMGTDLTLPAGTQVIDVTGQHVWPGLIALNTKVGIGEVGSVKGTNDLGEIGGNQPDIRVSASINPDSAHIAVTRLNGVTRAQTSPQAGGPMMGQSAVILLDGFTWEEMLTVDRDMLHVSFPRTGNEDKKKEEPEAVKQLSKLLAEAREYARLVDEAANRGSAMPRFDPRLQALRLYARGEKPVAFHVDNAQSILFAIKFAQEEELDAVLYGVSEGWKVAERIAESGFPVVVGPVLRTPTAEFDPYDAPYSNPAVLHRAGVDVAIMSNDEGNPRNLAYHAGMAKAFGLPYEEAIRSITLYPARTLGLDDRLGSLEPGKLADVIVTAGDLLDSTAPVTHVLIEGVPREMESRHTQLYQRYQKRLHDVQGR